MDLDNKPFIWRKKYAEQGVKIDEKQIELEQRQRAEANKRELEKIKERQRLRQLEYQQKLNDNEYLQRQKELEQHQHWEKQEDDFILKQHRQRSRIRIRDGRAQPIDWLAYYIDAFGEKPCDDKSDKKFVHLEEIDLSDHSFELKKNPCDRFNGLMISDLDKLETDIVTYMEADHEGNKRYWDDLLQIAKDESSKLRAVKNQEHTHSTVRTDITSLFTGQSIDELDDLETKIKSSLSVDDPSIDVEFYRKVLPMLAAYRAKLRLTRNHEEKSRSYYLFDSDKSKEVNPHDCEATEASSENNDEAERISEFEDIRKNCLNAYRDGNYSPVMLATDDLDSTIVLKDYGVEYEQLCIKRMQISKNISLPESAMSKDEQDFITSASKGMNKNEESQFSCEAPLKNQSYMWSDKYQPRKPRYFNRVHTGFEWNKYNQTHYDIDNPPPKVVQGYKFNIFYPDLIDKSKAPTFSITPCQDDKDFCIIRFSAGPPYEDIAFRIVNREWNNSHKSGYRCQFINNMLQLWFQFKRYRYRR